MQRHEVDVATHLVTAFEVEIRVPDGFPEAHREQLAEAARSCTVKQVIEAGLAQGRRLAG